MAGQGGGGAFGGEKAAVFLFVLVGIRYAASSAHYIIVDIPNELLVASPREHGWTMYRQI